MLNLSEHMKTMWKPGRENERRYGKDAAQQFAALENVRSATMEAFDLLAKESDDVLTARHVTSSFDLIWDLLSKEHERVLESLIKRCVNCNAPLMPGAQDRGDGRGAVLLHEDGNLYCNDDNNGTRAAQA